MLYRVFGCFLYSLVVLGSIKTTGQPPTTSSVQYQSYIGIQPELISGVSDEPAKSVPLVRHVYFVNDTILGIVIDAQSVERCAPIPYKQLINDSVILSGPRAPARLAPICGISDFLPPNVAPDSMVQIQRFVFRDGQPLGWLVGPAYEKYWPIEKLVGHPLNLDAISITSNYKIANKKGKQSFFPKKVFRKSKPHLNARIGPHYEHLTASRHEIFLVLNKALTEGEYYKITFLNGLKEISEVQFFADYKQLRSEAIHVNLAGYHPNQKPKLGFLSMWLGDGGVLNYDARDFYLIRVNDENMVYKGAVSLRMHSDSIFRASSMFGPDNYNKTHVYQLNFSDYKQPGQYKVYIPGVGVSFPFSIDEDIYKHAFTLQMKGFFHKRSGIEMGVPYTSYSRPRNQHPADGTPVYLCDKNTYFNDSLYSIEDKSYDYPFTRIANSIIPGTNADSAWGGWMDAADYDRRYLHFVAMHSMLDVVELVPDAIKGLDLGIPESGNAIPDILDEALWGLNLFLRTQEANGEIYFGIESIAHPNAGEASWEESLPIALVPGSPAIAYLYAAVAARMGTNLKPYDTVFSEVYISSAKKAVSWADDNLNNPLYKGALPVSHIHTFEACVYLFEATGSEIWRKRLIDCFNQAINSLKSINQDNIRGFYKLLTLSESLNLPDSSVRFIRENIIESADRLVALSNMLAYGEYEDFNYNCWFVGLYGSAVLANAYLITEDKKYLETIIEAGNFGMGANPLNASFTTGLGERFVYQWDEEALFHNLSIAAGVPVYGPFPYYTNRELPKSDFFWDKKKDLLYKPYLFPEISKWPVRETYFELLKFPAMNEFTIMQNMADQMYRWGLLHGVLNR
jgi:endoglucanase